MFNNWIDLLRKPKNLDPRATKAMKKVTSAKKKLLSQHRYTYKFHPQVVFEPPEGVILIQ